MAAQRRSWATRCELSPVLGRIAMSGFSNCFSSVLVRVSSEITKPRQGREFEGIYNISLELTNMASPAIENGRYDSLKTP